MKSNAIVRILLFSLAILILLGILIGAMAFNLYMVDGRIQFDRQDRMEAPVEALTQAVTVSSEVRNLQIEWVAGSIVIQPEEGLTEIIVQENDQSGKEYPMVYKQSGQTLKIQFCKDSIKYSGFGINEVVSKDLIIRVPTDWQCNELEIDAAFAEVEVHNLQIQEVDFDGASGQCIFDNCNVEELDIDTASGDVSFSGTLEVLECDAASADCTVEVFNTPKSIDMDAASGDLELILPPGTGFTCELDTMSGSFDSDFDFHTIGAHYECGDGACKIKVSAMSGDVNILKGIKPVENCNH